MSSSRIDRRKFPEDLVGRGPGPGLTRSSGYRISPAGRKAA